MKQTSKKMPAKQAGEYTFYLLAKNGKRWVLKNYNLKKIVRSSLLIGFGSRIHDLLQTLMIVYSL